MGILDQVRELLGSDTASMVKQREQEFLAAGRGPRELIFGELCFCVLTANTSAELGLMVQSKISPEFFISSDLETLTKTLKQIRYRFYNVRSRFIVNNRWVIDSLPDLLKRKDLPEMRDYLVENLDGIGYKEASHFLRNVGIFNFAILDKHILRLLASEFSMDLSKPPSRKKYLELEERFVEMASGIGMKPGILDLYLWKIATGKVLK